MNDIKAVDGCTAQHISLGPLALMSFQHLMLHMLPDVVGADCICTCNYQHYAKVPAYTYIYMYLITVQSSTVWSGMCVLLQCVDTVC